MMNEPDNYGFGGYDIGFELQSEFSLSVGDWGKNFIIFGVDNISSRQADNRKKDIQVLGEEPKN